MRTVIVRVRGLRPDFLGAYGNEWLPTPHLDDWAAAAVVFDRHFADAFDDAPVAPSAPADETRSPFELRRERLLLRSLADDPPDLLEIPIDALLPPWSLPDELAADFFDLDEAEPDADEEPLLPWTGPLPASIDPDDELTFERLQTTYAAAVAALDEPLAKLLRAAGKFADMVALTSDLGLALGEHGPVGREPSLHEEVVHLPLIVRFRRETGLLPRVAAITVSSDLSRPDDLLALARGERPQLRDRLVTRRGEWQSARTDDWLLIRRGDEPGRLFAKPEDRWEQCDLRQPNPAAAEELEAVLAAEAVGS